MSKSTIAGWRRIIHSIVSRPLITSLFSRIVVPVDRVIMKQTRGHFSPTGFIAGWPIVNLTTTGARTGLSRTTAVVGIPDGQKIVLIASNFGKSRYPSWYYNLKKHPIAIITHKGSTRTFKAHEASEEERQEGWQLALEIYPGYKSYAQNAGRPIPILILEAETASQRTQTHDA